MVDKLWEDMGMMNSLWFFIWLVHTHGDVKKGIGWLDILEIQNMEKQMFNSLTQLFISIQGQPWQKLRLEPPEISWNL